MNILRLPFYSAKSSNLVTVPNFKFEELFTTKLA